jgi:hypothetical protein
MELNIRPLVLIVPLFVGTATLLCAQQYQQRHRREHMVCPIDGARMDWTGNQQGGMNPSCEFSHVAFAANGQRADHKAWASCSENDN